MIQVYTQKELSMMNGEAIGKYVTVQGVLYNVVRFMCKHEAECEQERRARLSPEHRDLRDYYLIQMCNCLGTYCLCKREYL